MKEPLDNFSGQSKAYHSYRPTYPEEVYSEILSLVRTKNRCWDCGTGNGQVAIQLSINFEEVCASDISENQLSHAPEADNIEYSVQRAEQTSFPGNNFDLITVAQAVHWFDLDAFATEVQRVAKEKAVLAILGYGLLRFGDATDTIVDTFYHDVTGPYWDEERRHLDHEYETIRFPFKEVLNTKEHSIRLNWSLKELEGYFNSWSAVQHYKKANNGDNPVDEIIRHMNVFWDEDEIKEVRFPLYLKAWEVA